MVCTTIIDKPKFMDFWISFWKSNQEFGQILGFFGFLGFLLEIQNLGWISKRKSKIWFGFPKGNPKFGLDF